MVQYVRGIFFNVFAHLIKAVFLLYVRVALTVCTMPGVAGRFCLREEGEQGCHGRCGSLRGGVGGEDLPCRPVPLARGKAVRHTGEKDLCAARRPRLLVMSPRLLVGVR